MLQVVNSGCFEQKFITEKFSSFIFNRKMFYLVKVTDPVTEGRYAICTFRPFTISQSALY